MLQRAVQAGQFLKARHEHPFTFSLTEGCFPGVQVANSTQYADFAGFDRDPHQADRRFNYGGMFLPTTPPMTRLLPVYSVLAHTVQF